MTARLAFALAMFAGSMQAAAEPSTTPDVPSEELLEYLGTWNGDEEWLHSGELQPTERSANRVPEEKQERDRAKPRDPAEQEQ